MEAQLGSTARCAGASGMRFEPRHLFVVIVVLGLLPAVWIGLLLAGGPEPSVNVPSVRPTHGVGDAPTTSSVAHTDPSTAASKKVYRTRSPVTRSTTTKDPVITPEPGRSTSVSNSPSPSSSPSESPSLADPTTTTTGPVDVEATHDGMAGTELQAD